MTGLYAGGPDGTPWPRRDKGWGVVTVLVVVVVAIGTAIVLLGQPEEATVGPGDIIEERTGVTWAIALGAFRSFLDQADPDEWLNARFKSMGCIPLSDTTGYRCWIQKNRDCVAVTVLARRNVKTRVMPETRSTVCPRLFGDA